MNITLNNPTILGISNNFEFSPGGIAIRQVQNISLEGILLSLNSQTGVDGIWNQIKTYNSSSFDGFITITINGITYTNAKINSFDFGESVNQDVLTKPFNLNFEVYSEFGSSSDKDYLDPYALQDVESISDNFSLNITEDNTKEYNHSFSVSYFNKTGSNLISAGRTIAQGILSTNKYALSMLGGGYTDSLKRYYNETFDVYKGTYSLDENFKYFGNTQNNTSVSSGISMQLGNGGVLTLSEDVQIQGLVDDKYTNALNQFNILYPGSYTRCNNFLSSLSSEIIPANIILSNIATSRSVVRNEFLGTINYTIQFTNELKYTPSVIKDSTITYTKNEDGFVEVNEDGAFTAYGKNSINNPSANAKFLSALSSYSSTHGSLYSSQISTSITTLGQGLLNFGTTPAKYKLLGTSLNFIVTEGKINFSHNYSNKKIYDIENKFKSISANYSEDDTVPSVQLYQVPGFGPAGGKELAQFLSQSTPIKQTVSVEIRGNKNLSIQDYISKFNTYIPSLSQPNYLLSKNYSYDPINNNFQGAAEWILFDKRTRTRNNFVVNRMQGGY